MATAEAKRCAMAAPMPRLGPVTIATPAGQRPVIEIGLVIRQPLFRMPWEDHLDRRLDDITEQVGLKVGPASA